MTTTCFAGELEVAQQLRYSQADTRRFTHLTEILTSHVLSKLSTFEVHAKIWICTGGSENGQFWPRPQVYYHPTHQAQFTTQECQPQSQKHTWRITPIAKERYTATHSQNRDRFDFMNGLQVFFPWQRRNMPNVIRP